MPVVTAKQVDGAIPGTCRGVGHNAGALLYFALFVAVVLRLPIGVDLSDEAYYAIFLDDWLKGGTTTSTLSTLHQTAALIVYPLTLIYAKIMGSSVGLILFLRGVFLCGTVVAAFTWLAFLHRIERSSLIAWLGASLILSFIPFGLPAPSYNTTGQQALIVALSALGCAMILPRSGWSQRVWLAASALGWTISVVAYPSMALPMVVCCLAVFAGGRNVIEVGPYIGSLVALQIVAWTMVQATLSWDRLVESVVYLRAINDVGGLERKFSFSLGLLGEHSVFAASCVAAIAISVFRRRLGPILSSILILAVISTASLVPAALFCRSHDVITLLALTGAGTLAGLRPGASQVDRTIALVWAISFLAGITTMASAFNSLYNFCIGAAPAAYLSLAALRPSGQIAKMAVISVHFVVLAALASTSLTFYYGDGPDFSEPRRRIDWGAYAGLSAAPDNAAVLEIVRDHVAPLLREGETIAVFGRRYGLILATPARPLALAVFPVDGSMKPEGIEMTRSFYADPGHLPDAVLIYRDRYIDMILPIEPMQMWYELVGTYEAPPGSLQIFQRKSTH